MYGIRVEIMCMNRVLIVKVLFWTHVVPNVVKSTIPAFSSDSIFVVAKARKLTRGLNVFQIWIINIWCLLRFGCVFRKCVLPEGLAKELPEMMKIPKSLDLIDCTMVLTMSTCEFDAESAPDAIKHIPDLFCKDPGPANKV